MFDIRFLDKNLDSSQDDKNELMGVMTLNEKKEKFYSPICFWSKQKYEINWLNAVKKIINGKSKSVIITSMIDPKLANFIITWPIYRINNKVFIQNTIIFSDELVSISDFNSLEKVIDDYSSIDDDGNKISSWEFNLSDIIDFYNRI